MKTIKIIDLLNKIANGEEVPKKIDYQDEIYEWDEELQKYGDQSGYTLEIYTKRMDLTETVEIIEDEQLKESDVYTTITNSYWSTEQSNELISNFCNHEIAINKLIREVNKLKSMN